MSKDPWPPEWAARAAARMSGARTEQPGEARRELDKTAPPPAEAGGDPRGPHAAGSRLFRPSGDPDQMAAAIPADLQSKEQPTALHPSEIPAAAVPAHAFWRHCGILAGAIFALACLGGVYAETKYLSHFDISYLRYAGPSDLLTGFVSFVRVALTPGFAIAFVLSAALLTTLVAGVHYLARAIRALALFVSRGRPLAPAHEAIKETFSEQFRDEDDFWSRTRAVVARPYPALLIAAVASFVGINVTVSAATGDLLEFADSFEDNPSADAASYEVVAVADPGTAGSWEQVLRLGATSEFQFYYDLATERAVVLPKEVAKETSRPAPPDRAAEEATTTAASFDVRSTLVNANVEPPDRTKAADAPIASSRDRSAAAPVPAVLVPHGSSSGGPLAVQTAVADDGHPLAARQSTTVAEATEAVEDQPPAPPPQAPDRPANLSALSAMGDTEGLTGIEGNVDRSRDRLGELKTHLGHVEGSFVKIREFVNDLDFALDAIDQAFADLQKQLAIKDAALAHANCDEQSFSQPIRFEPQQADLSLTSVGLLFQARRQFARDRSAERQEWLVIEAHADDATGPAGQALAEQRGEAVRRFLQTELGVPGETLKVVVRGADTPPAGDVRILDCLKRSPGTLASASRPQSELPLIKSASAAELPSEPSPQPAVVRAADRGSVQLAMLSEDLDVREDQRGWLLSVPGHLLFETASTGIEPPAHSLLDEIGELLIRDPGREALIIGHSDALGDASYNLDLSQRRAQSVRRYLLENFDIAADMLRAEGRGEQDPIASNDTREGRSANRRIEVLLLD